MQEVLERTKLPAVLTLFKYIVSFALFNYSILHTLVSMVISPTIVLWLNSGTTVGPFVAQIWLQLLYNNDLVIVFTKRNP
jgi:hypothetical protein